MSATAQSRPPIDPQGVIDLIFAGTFNGSSDKSGVALGEFFLSNWFNMLRQRHAADPVALAYLDGLMPIVGSALRAFSVEKLNYKRRILPLERLAAGEEALEEEMAKGGPLATLRGASNSWSARIIKGGFTAGASSLITLHFRDNAVYLLPLYFIAAASGITLVLHFLTLVYRRWRLKSAAEQAEKDLEKAWDSSYRKYTNTLFDAMVSTIRLKEEHYPHLPTFYDGHLFPRNDLPYLPPSTFRALTPSQQPTAKLINLLMDIVTARISIRPDTDKKAWLLGRLEVRVP